jgi:NADH dehydrogenase
MRADVRRRADDDRARARLLCSGVVSDEPGRILLTGANGHLGRRLLLRLARDETGRPVRAVVRSERAASTLRELPEAARPEIRIVDYGDATQLSLAARDCRYAVHLLGILKQTRANRYEDAHERAAEALAEAAAAAGLRRIVYLSILGSRADSSNACLASKGRAEDILLAAKTPTLVLRVPMVIGSGDIAAAALERRARAGRVRLVRGGASLEQPIAADDVIDAILAGLERDGLDDEALDLAGPESLSHRAPVERAAALLSTDVKVGSIPLLLVRLFAAAAERFTANPPITPAMLGVLEHDDDVDPAPACRRLGITLTPLDEALGRAFTNGGSPT